MYNNKRTKFSTLTILLLAVSVMLLSLILRRSIITQDRLDDMVSRHQQAVDYVLEHTNEDIFGVLSAETIKKGNLHMVSAQVVGEDGDLTTFIDENGVVWAVKGLAPINDSDVVLLWIVDNHTMNDTTDDEVVRVFIEAHKG